MLINRRHLLEAATGAVLATPIVARAATQKPVLFWFYTSEEVSLRKAPVSSSTFAVASVDLPCHGRDVRLGEPPQLAGWRYRVDHGEDLLGRFIEQCRSKLDSLVASGKVDPSSVFCGGVSRGGYAALSLSLADARFHNVIGLSPVVDLMALTEFKGCEVAPPPLSTKAAALSTRPIFLSIESRDHRVGASNTIGLVDAIATGRRDADIELVLDPGDVHTVTDRAMRAAQRWINDRVTHS